MKPSEVIDSYVTDVIRRVPRRDRDEVGLELRGLLNEMLDDRALGEGRTADDAMVLAMLRDFGTPTEVAGRYREPGMVIIPEEQTRSFALTAVIGVSLQWALTLPQVFQGEPLSRWWLTWGVGALWWPGLMAMGALAVACLRRIGLLKSTWRPRTVDPDRINRAAMGFGLVWFAIGVAFVTCLPWTVTALPQPLSQVFAFDPAFLHARVWPALLLWGGHFAVMVMAFAQGRWSARMRSLDIAFGAAWLALLGWWLVAGNVFLAEPTNDGFRGAITLVMLIIAVDLAIKLHRRRTQIRMPAAIG
ncbi:hypothetical protein [Lysobacter tyrosinilyticus]